jgi:hypothetical protein
MRAGDVRRTVLPMRTETFSVSTTPVHPSVESALSQLFEAALAEPDFATPSAAARTLREHGASSERSNQTANLAAPRLIART